MNGLPKKARRVVFFARYEASQIGSPYIETEHILLGLLREAGHLVQSLLPNARYDSLRQEIVDHSPFHKGISVSVDLPLSNECKRVLAYAAEEAERLSHGHIGTEHLFLGLLREQRSYAARLLTQHGADLTNMRARIADLPESWEDAGPYSLYKPLTEPVTIHGAPFDPKYVEASVTDCRRFLWQKRTFVAPDIVIRRPDGAISFDTGLAQGSSVFHLVEGGWNESSCLICRFRFSEGDDPERNVGYTNGRDWLCTECHERFLAPGSKQA